MCYSGTTQNLPIPNFVTKYVIFCELWETICVPDIKNLGFTKYVMFMNVFCVVLLVTQSHSAHAHLEIRPYYQKCKYVKADWWTSFAVRCHDNHSNLHSNQIWNITKMGLQPLEFSDCLTDSPYFREKLHTHEKEIERTSKSIKALISECKDVLNATRGQYSGRFFYYKSTIQ